MDDPRNPALEQAIANDPFDREAYRVYADWLEGQGDIRAQLIRLQLAGPDGKPVRKLFAEHQRYFLGPLARMSQQLVWKNGFIHSASFSDPTIREGDVALVLAHSSARFVVEIRASSISIEETIAALARAPASLRTLSLRRAGGRTMASTAALADVLPQLHALSLLGGIAFAQMPLPRLRSLVLDRDLRAAIDITFPALTQLTVGGIGDIGTIDAPLLESATITIANAERVVAEARWPAIQRLALEDIDPNALAPLFARTDMPQLTQLVIKGATDNVALCRLLRGAPFAKQLQRLQLSSGALGDDAARELARGEFPALVELDASNNVLGEAGYAVLDELDLVELVDDRRYEDTGE